MAIKPKKPKDKKVSGLDSLSDFEKSIEQRRSDNAKRITKPRTKEDQTTAISDTVYVAVQQYRMRLKIEKEGIDLPLIERALGRGGEDLEEYIDDFQKGFNNSIVKPTKDKDKKVTQPTKDIKLKRVSKTIQYDDKGK